MPRQSFDYMLDPPDEDIYDPEDVCEDCGENHVDCECGIDEEPDDDYCDEPRDINDGYQDMSDEQERMHERRQMGIDF